MGRATDLQSTELIFVKLGGSLITDKTQAYVVNRQRLGRLASETCHVLDARPEVQMVLGHGSGSFGHWAAKPYGIRDGVQTPAEWRGFAEVSAAANRLNRIVTDVFLEAGIPVLSIQPSASARCGDGKLEALDTYPIRQAMLSGLIPLVYGDVAWDDVRGGTIISTEDIFFFLAAELRPSRILLLGEAPGVVDLNGQVVPWITPENLDRVRQALGGSRGVDVTGGMETKVLRMLDLVRQVPDTLVHVIGGSQPDSLRRAILDPTLPDGTRISASAP